MIERKNASAARRSDVIYNPIEEKWERKLTSKYLGDLDDFSLEKEVSIRISDMKNKAISTKKTAESFVKSESVKVHINDLKSSMKDSIQKLKELSEEITDQDENTVEIHTQSQIEDNDSEIEEQEQNYKEEYNETLNQDSEDSEENQSLTLLKIVIAIIGLIVAFVSN